MFGKTFSYTDKTSHIRQKAVNIIMTEDETSAFIGGCDNICDQFSEDLKNRLRDYVPYNEEERKFCGEKPGKNIVVFENEFPVFIEVLMEYIGIIGVEIENTSSYVDIIKKQEEVIKTQNEVIKKLKMQLESVTAEDNPAMNTLLEYIQKLSGNKNISNS